MLEQAIAELQKKLDIVSKHIDFTSEGIESDKKALKEQEEHLASQIELRDQIAKALEVLKAADSAHQS